MGSIRDQKGGMTRPKPMGLQLFQWLTNAFPPSTRVWAPAIQKNAILVIILIWSAQTALAQSQFSHRLRAAHGVNIFEAKNARAGLVRPEVSVKVDVQPVDHENARTLKTWKGRFSSEGVKYGYTMVGTEPSLGSTTTTIPVVIIPLRFVFANGKVFDASTDFSGVYTPVQGIINSPIFQPTPFFAGATYLGTTQFGDAYQRANFWNFVSTVSPDYHVLLGDPQVTATQLLAVPDSEGFASTDASSGRPFAAVHDDWLNPQLLGLIAQLNIDPHSLAIFVGGSVLHSNTDETAFGTGTHLAGVLPSVNGTKRVQTYIYAGYPDLNLFGGYAPDVTALSHEIAEWLDDPFNDNVVPSWSNPPEHPYAPEACGGSALEVGDPIDTLHFTMPFNGMDYHLQDMIFLSWFERASPSNAVNGYYSFKNNVSSVAEPCADSRYTFITLDYPGAPSTFLYDINNKDQIVGGYVDASNAFHSFLLDRGVFSLVDYPGAIFTQVSQINDAGQLVGFYIDVGESVHGFLRTDEGFSQIDVPGAANTFALGINDRDIVGGYVAPDGIVHGFLLRAGQFSVVDPPFAFEDEIDAISNNGVMAGDYDNGNVTDDFAFIGRKGSFSSLTFPGATVTTPYGINEKSEVCGTYYDALGFVSGFVMRKSKVERVEFFDGRLAATLIFGNNDSGVLAGSYFRQGFHGLLARPK